MWFHKNFLGTGMHHSEYFEGLFKLSQWMEELENATINVHFKGLTAIWFMRGWII